MKRINKNTWLVIKTVGLTLTAVALVIASIALVVLNRERNMLFKAVQDLSSIGLNDDRIGMTIIFKKDILRQCGYQLDNGVYLYLKQMDNGD